VTGAGVIDGQGYKWWYVRRQSPAVPRINMLRHRICRSHCALPFISSSLSLPSVPSVAFEKPSEYTCTLVGRWAVFLTTKDHRPDLLRMNTCTNLLIHNLRFWNSPQYHIDLHNVLVRARATDCLVQTRV
jgi:hypothetical protein